MDHSQKAWELFNSGCNCAQAVFVAFSDVTGLDPALAARLSSSFGGGMGRMREVCGALSSVFMVAGILYGYEDPGPGDRNKAAHYARIQELAAAFRARHGTIVCRELLDNPPSDPNPTPRTAAFYAGRPCGRFIVSAAEILDAYIQEHPPTNRIV